MQVEADLETLLRIFERLETGMQGGLLHLLDPF